MRILTVFLGLSFFATAWVSAVPPTDPKTKAVYDHDKEWLTHFPNSFIASNIRGEGLQYAERRAAALDLIREHRDQTAVPELITELNAKSFLSEEICDVLGDWRAKKAIPALRDAEADKNRPKAVRAKARAALDKINQPDPKHV